VCDKNNTYLYKDANSGMAKGGSGDILAGAIASFVSQGYSLIDSALTGVFLHAKAGEITAEKLGERFMLPSDVINEFSSVLKKL
jgi:NAD(P)H-hydrate epimerase